MTEGGGGHDIAEGGGRTNKGAFHSLIKSSFTHHIGPITTSQRGTGACKGCLLWGGGGGGVVKKG